MAYLSVTFSVEGEIVVHSPSLPPQNPLPHPVMESMFRDTLASLPESASRQLSLPRDPASRYEHGDDFFRLIVTDMPGLTTVKAPWEFGHFMVPLLERLKIVRQAFADISLEADILIYVTYPDNKCFPGWFISSVRQHEPEVSFFHLPEIEGFGAIRPAS